MRHLKIFNVEKLGDILVVTPMGEGSAFRYQDLHLESNVIRQQMMKPENKHLVMNLAQLTYFGSEFIGSLVSMMRETRARGGQARFCSANEQMKQVLQNMSLFKLWPHFDSIEDALANIKETGK
ncbi:STAS domain-containing protein [Thalassoglobus sp.]|uniref:STAS domain-containing protein n=1 Tax=Thalassoglobus sp. TaxID=2795869 RepID=UPI003AA821A7